MQVEKAMAPHSSTLAWKIPWTEEPGRLQPMESHRVGHDWSDFTFPFHFHALEKEMATHSSTLAGRIPGTEESGGLPSMGAHRVGHDWSDLAAAAAAAAAENERRATWFPNWNDPRLLWVAIFCRKSQKRCSQWPSALSSHMREERLGRGGHRSQL